MSVPEEAFTVIDPIGSETPLIVEVPHAGLAMDAQALALCIAPGRSIGQDADLYVSELFADAPQHGAHLLFSNMSRYFCDLNREENEFDNYTCAEGTAANAPYGVVWRKTTEGRSAIMGQLPLQEVERRLNLVYRPYHHGLARLIERKKQKFGYAILLCGHSMPSCGRLGERRADVVPGTRGRSSADPRVIAVADQEAARAGFTLSHDNPYRGGYTTSHYGSPAAGVHAMQIELSRRLYMDENSLSRLPGQFEKCADFCMQLVQSLSQVRL